ncbi:MAG: hypothetical protein EOO01_12060 [Chitinophagaceae bacterium]|nr:MAG: hypothetical protein EOO01_12060 [Chitinophagaceae bacterium]
MKELLKTEWLKYKNYNVFMIMSVLFAVGVVAANYIVYVFNKNVVGAVNTGGLVSSFSPYNFDNTWQTTSYATGYLLIIPAMLLIILVTNEYTFRTSRQNIIDGWSRKQFINVKLAVALIFTVISTLLVILTALGFGFASGSTFSFEGFSHVGFFFMKSLSYNLLAVMISVWIRRTGFAIGLYFIYLGAENIISQLLDVWSVQLRSYEGVDLGALGDYLPMNASDGLLTFPDNPLKSIAKSTLPTEYPWVVAAFVVFYLVLFYTISKRKVLKTDL